jgi:hypothetical protein
MTSDVRRRALAAIALVLVAGACSGGDDGPSFALDGSPRFPDDEGIVTAVDFESVTLDGERTYDIDGDVVSFSSIDLKVIPLLFTEHQYVQVGLDGDTARWIGALARPLQTDPPAVLFVGEIEAIGDGQVTFDNGTVVRVADGVDVKTGDADVRVAIDPRAGEITEVES